MFGERLQVAGLLRPQTRSSSCSRGNTRPMLAERQRPTTTSSSRPFRTAQITSSCFVPMPSLSCMR